MNPLHLFHCIFHAGVLPRLAQNSAGLLLLVLCSAASASTATSNPAFAGEAKRIEVYPLSQNFHDVEAGETLQQIVLQLLPNRPAQRAQLMQDIVRLNPTAFIQQDPNRLKADVRLWLPNNPPHYAPQLDAQSVHIESFSWGQVIRRRQP